MVDAYRAPLRSRRDDVEAALTLSRALALGLVGLGEVADERAARRLERFCAVPDGAFAWTRSPEGHILGRIVGDCRQDRSPEALAADLVHVRSCAWLPGCVDAALVPDQVRHAFARGGRNFQRIGLAGAGAATARVWDLLG